MIGPGSKLAGRYVVERALGSGGMATVFAAHDMQLGRDVAVKVLAQNLHASAEDGFRREALALARLNHPSILQVLDQGVDAGALYLVLERLDGGTLQDRIEARPLTEPELVEVGRQLVSALAAAHGAKILHRDLKPGNVLIADDGSVRLADFGLARIGPAATRGLSGQIVGTPEYMAPELFEGKSASTASDIYSLGGLLFHALNGRPPFMGAITDIVRMARESKRPGSRGSPKLADLILRCLAPLPAERPSLAEIDKELERLARREPGAPQRTMATSRPELPAAKPAARPAPSGPTVSRPAAVRPTVVSSRDGLGPDLAPPARGPAPGPAPARRVPLVPFLALAVTVMGGAYGLVRMEGAEPGNGPSPPVAPTAAAGAGEDEPPELFVRWQELLDQVDVPDTVRTLQRKILGEDGLIPYIEKLPQEKMMLRRRGADPKSFGSKDRYEMLAREKTNLPLYEAIGRDRKALEEALADPAIPLRHRMRLFTRLQELEQLDAYYLAWGEPPPLELAPMLAALVRSRVQDLRPQKGKPPVDRATAGARVPQGGKVLPVFSWQRPEDVEHPWLFAPGDHPSEIERYWIGQARDRTGGAFDPYSHERLEGSVTLEAAPTGVATLSFLTGNLIPPNTLSIRIAGQELVFHPPASMALDWEWRDRCFPEHRIEIDFPAGILKEGTNRIDMRVLPIAGMKSFSATEVDRVELVLR